MGFTSMNQYWKSATAALKELSYSVFLDRFSYVLQINSIVSEGKAFYKCYIWCTIQISINIQKVQRLTSKNYFKVHFYIDFHIFCRSTVSCLEWRVNIFIRAIFSGFLKIWYFGSEHCSIGIKSNSACFNYMKNRKIVNIDETLTF